MGNRGAVNLGSGDVERTGRKGERKGCGQDVLYGRRMNLNKNTSGKPIVSCSYYA